MEPLLVEVLEQLEEYRSHVTRAVERIPAAALWKRPREGVSSPGNLLLHLAGNESHYIGHVIGGSGYARDRSGEFGAEGGPPAGELLDALAGARATTREVFERLTAAELERVVDSNWPPRPTVLRVILHVAEHYAYHAGQIVLHARLLQSAPDRVLDWGH